MARGQRPADRAGAGPLQPDCAGRAARPCTGSGPGFAGGPAPARRTAPAAVRPFASGPVPAPAAEAPAAQPAPQAAPAAEAQPDPASPPPWDEPSQTPPPPAEAAPARDEPLPPPPAGRGGRSPRPSRTRRRHSPPLRPTPSWTSPAGWQAGTSTPYPQWPEVVDRIRDTDPMLYGYPEKIEGLLRRGAGADRRGQDLPGFHPG